MHIIVAQSIICIIVIKSQEKRYKQNINKSL